MKVARKSFKVEVPSVAMGDIAFNLLVFFVILAKATDDSHVEVEYAQTPDVEAVKHPRASIAIDKNNKLYFNGREVAEQQLPQAIEARLEGAPAGARTVILKINRSAQHLRFKKVLEAVSEAGGEIVHVLDEKKD